MNASENFPETGSAQKDRIAYSCIQVDSWPPKDGHYCKTHFELQKLKFTFLPDLEAFTEP